MRRKPSYPTAATASSVAYYPPDFPVQHANEAYRSAMASMTTPMDDSSGNGRNLVNIGVVTLRPCPSYFPGKIGMAFDAKQQTMGLINAAFQRNTEWTIDAVVTRPTESNTTIFIVANTAYGGILGGVRLLNDTIEVNTGGAWVATGIILDGRYFDYSAPPTWAITLQWGADEILRLWLNGFLVYTSGVLANPPIIGNEGLIRYGDAFYFLRYIAAAPSGPADWHASALFGESR